MKVVLLAAGTGSRLKPITDTTPKCLVPIAGKPLLDYWLEMLENREDISDIYINVSYLADKVLSHLSTLWSCSTKIKVWQEASLLGTAGTLCLNNKELYGSDVLVVHADNLSFFDVDAFFAAHFNRPSNCMLTMMLFETDNPTQCGIVELDEKHRVIDMHEKVSHPPGNLANAAVYVFSPQIIAWLGNRSLFDISEDVIPCFKERIATWKNTVYHRDVGTPASYAQAQDDAKSFPERGITFSAQ